jgi:hypothetical protein
MHDPIPDDKNAASNQYPSTQEQTAPSAETLDEKKGSNLGSENGTPVETTSSPPAAENPTATAVGEGKELVPDEKGVSGSNEIDNGERESTTEVEDESKYLSGVKLWILSLGLCLTTFVIALDNTIIATAIPKITTVFNSLEDVGWYGSSYLLTTCSLQPSFGKVYTYFDVKYTYLFALLLFELGPSSAQQQRVRQCSSSVAQSPAQVPLRCFLGG